MLKDRFNLEQYRENINAFFVSYRLNFPKFILGEIKF
jgi:hypothetical protein